LQAVGVFYFAVAELSLGAAFAANRVAAGAGWRIDLPMVGAERFQDPFQTFHETSSFPAEPRPRHQGSRRASAIAASVARNEDLTRWVRVERAATRIGARAPEDRNQHKDCGGRLQHYVASEACFSLQEPFTGAETAGMERSTGRG